MKEKIPEIQLSEAPGLYGSFAVGEKLIQKIWHDQELVKENLKTTAGKRLEILNCGKWNLAEEGPDFKDATLSIDGSIISGDIEIHFEEKDWRKHGHDKDQTYSKVILHVLLYPPENANHTTASKSKGKITTLVLLPYLLKSVEEYAEDAAMEKLSGISSTKIKPPNFPGNWMEVKGWAKKRWMQKCLYARKRLDSAGWEGACHQWVLEVLGYRRNRRPMAQIAQSFPAKVWRKGLEPENVYASQTAWKLRGCRPANHPRKRLQQYDQLIKNHPNWMRSLQSMQFKIDPGLTPNLIGNRKTMGLKACEKEFAEDVLGGAIGGTRLHTVIIDACLPLWSAHHQKEVFETWFHWTAGDVPSNFLSWSREIGLINRNHPFLNGLAQAIIHGSIHSALLQSSSQNSCHTNQVD